VTRQAIAKPVSKHQQRTESTRRALIDSARVIFVRDGFEACRIEDIAAATGHTRGAFYAHFESKEDLFFALLEQEAGRRLERLRSILALSKTDEDKLSALRDYFVSRISDRQWTMLTLEFKLFALRRPRLRPRLAATHRRVRASLKLEGIEKISDEPTKAALEAILAGFTLEHAYDPERLPKGDATKLLALLFDALLRR
jgi:AcrR family transcriptional regulator